MLRYDALIAFQKVLECGSFRKAALALNLSQPNLSYTIRKLEESLATSLFDRDSRGVHLTESGKIFSLRVQELSEMWEGLCTDLSSGVKDARWRLIIGAHPEVAAYSLPLFLPDLLERFPHLLLKVQHGLSREINQRIIDSEIDVGIVINPLPQPDLIIKEIGEDYVTLWCHDEKCHQQVLIFDPNLAQSQWILRQLDKRRLFSRHIECTNLTVIKAMVAAGTGVGILPARVAQGLKEFGDTMPRFSDKICLVYKRRFKEKKIAGQVIDAIIAAFNTKKGGLVSSATFSLSRE